MSIVPPPSEPSSNPFDHETEQRVTPPAGEPVEPVEQARSRSPWVAGLILIVLGIIFLLQNFGLQTINNWWALFILIPAIGSFASAWRMYQSNGGQMTGQVRGSLVGGLILTLVTAAFLFSLDWKMIWPFFLIIIGIAALAGGFLRQ